MKIAAITVTGFKSFGDRTTVEFAPGVTALIGPNGSGKSNIIDALKWATGGGRASSYRADDKRALIFHGASGKRSMGLAEVEVEFVTDDGSTKVARTLDRDGLTKLRLDGRNARFMDVDEALAGSGLGRAGVSVIGQGEVSQVLMADPEKLLGYVAEAAGVAKLSGRRTLAAARLETARQHLERLLDVSTELEAVVTRLETEAREANRFNALERERLLLRFTISGRRVQALQQELGELAERRETLEARLAGGRGRLEQAETDQQAARAALARAEVVLREAVAETERRQGNLRIAEERRLGLEARSAGAASRLGRIREELAQLATGAVPTPPAGDAAALEAEEQTAAALLAAARTTLETSEAKLSALEATLERLRQRVAANAEQAAGIGARRNELERQRDEIVAALEALDAAAPSDSDDLASELEALAAERVVLEAALEAASRNASDALLVHQEAVAQAAALARDLERQQASFEARRGYAQGARQALTSGIDGIIGSVADLLEVPEAFREAIGAALGRRAENIVVETSAVAEAILAHVRRHGGWVTVLPLDLLRPARRSPFDPSGTDGVVGLAVDLVRSDPRYERVVAMLLGNVLVMEGFKPAVALARRRRSRPRLVTLAGDVIETSGAMSGGRPLQRGQVVGLAEDLRHLQTELQAAESARDGAAAVRAAAERDHQAARLALAVLDERADRLQETSWTREAARQRHQERRDDLTRRQTAVAAALETAATVSPEAGEEARELETLTAAAALAREVWNENSERFRRASAQHLAAERASLIFEGEQLAYREAALRHRTQSERAASLRALETDLSRELEQLLADGARAEAEVEAAREALPHDLAVRQQQREEADVSLGEADRTFRQLTEDQAALSQELEACRLQQARRSTALEVAEEEWRSFPEGLEELHVGERAARSRLREVAGELDAIGPVNHRAADEYEQNRARLTSLRADMAEAEAAAHDLERVLTDIDQETTRRLDVACSGLDTLFQRHVQELFGEAAVGSIEVERDEGRPTGLRIHLQPPGKRTQALGLLSVGERTMGAMAFLFALMADGDGEGLPVAVLDEVDAPLDEANIRRYCAFLERLATRGTQFVLVTHQKATFEVADVLWGVTTEQGVSRVFSIRKEEGLGIE